MRQYLAALCQPLNLHWRSAVARICTLMLQVAVRYHTLCQHYLELWCVLSEELRTHRDQATWDWWLTVCRRELRRVPSGPHEIKMGHRLLNSLFRVMDHTHTLSACFERKDPFTAALRRVWPSSHGLLSGQADKIRAGLTRLCDEDSNTNDKSRAAITADLRRVILAYRMGWLTGHQTTGSLGKHQICLTGFRDPGSLTWDPVNAHDTVRALRAYLAWYMRTNVTLRCFAAVNLQDWPELDVQYRQPAHVMEIPRHFNNQPKLSAWVPMHSFAFLVQFIGSDPNLRTALLAKSTDDDGEGPSVSYLADLELHAHAVFDALDQLTWEQTHDISDAALDCATWKALGEHLLISDDTIEHLETLVCQHYARENIKTKFRLWIESLQANVDTSFKDLTALATVFRLWKERHDVYTVNTPIDWTERVTQEYARREKVDKLTVSPMCDVFMFCPTCLRVCSICAPTIGSPFEAQTSGGGRHKRKRRNLGKRAAAAAAASSTTSSSVAAAAAAQTTVAGEPIFSAGFQDVVNDVDTGRFVCASRKTGTLAERCRGCELQIIHLTGKLLVYYGRVFVLCPQPRCARIMELEPDVCRYNDFGPCCSVCTALRVSPIVIEEAPVALLKQSAEDAIERAILAAMRAPSFNRDSGDDNNTNYDDGKLFDDD